jgi:sulfur carrier protein
MNVIVNNEPVNLENGATVSALMNILFQDEIRGKAVAINDNVVPRNEWDSTQLTENQNILIITATQGG